MRAQLRCRDPAEISRRDVVEICAPEPIRHVAGLTFHVSLGPHCPRVTRASLSTCHSQLGDILLGADEMACHVADEERTLEEARDTLTALRTEQVPLLPRRLLLLWGIFATWGSGVVSDRGNAAATGRLSRCCVRLLLSSCRAPLFLYRALPS